MVCLCKLWVVLAVGIVPAYTIADGLPYRVSFEGWLRALSAAAAANGVARAASRVASRTTSCATSRAAADSESGFDDSAAARSDDEWG